MPWKKIDAFMESYKGRYVRFVQPHSAANMTKQFKINNAQSTNVRLAAGAVGKIYEVRGATMYIGFSQDLRTAPASHTQPTGFAATIQFYINDSDKIEVDL